MTDSGIGKDSRKSLSTTITIVCFVALALYNVAELNFIIFATFRVRRGLYFWSFLVSTWGICLYAIGFLLKDIQASTPSSFYVTFIIVGWCSMVTGQSFVLYSRLHLVLRMPSRLRLVLIMIIVDAIICHVPICVMVYGANSSNSAPFLVPYSIYEKVQVTVFFIQELIISILYIFQTLKILRPEGNIRGKSSRRVMTHLIYVNVIIVVLDITILGLEYSGLYDIQTVYKGFVYSVKLKLEFSILNRLIELTRSLRLETFDEDRRKQTATGNDKQAGYKAYVTSGRAGSAGTSGVVNCNNDSIVVTRTQIAIHSEVPTTKQGAVHRPGDCRDGERDLESFDVESVGNGIEGENRVRP
jgi:hypothetical protein